MLSLSRKADRARMATALVALVEQKGATATRREEGDEIAVSIDAARGTGVTIRFRKPRRRSGPGYFLWCWNVHGLSDARFSERFGPSVNPHHFQKASDAADTFEGLCADIAPQLDRIRDGTAFDARREADYVAEHGTAADRQAAWGTHFAQWAAERAAGKGSPA